MNYVLLSGSIEDLSPDVATQTALREGLFQRGKGGSRIYRKFCNKKQIEHQKLLKEKPDISVNEFSIFHNYKIFS